MEKIYLSDAGPKVSPAIYGFYRWAEENDPATTMREVVSRCLESGINTFDHADVYGHYRCETLFGNLMQSGLFRRQDVILFARCGIVLPDPARPDIRVKHYNTSKPHILASVDNSLRRLRTDYIDVFLLDHLDPLSDPEETALTLTRLKESGKIKFIGVANYTVFQHQLLAAFLRLPVVTSQVDFNLLQTEALDNGQIDYIKQRFMRPLASSPLAAGRIATGTDAVAIRVRKKLLEIAPRYEADIESVAVAWLIKCGALPLIGTTSLQRIKNIAGSFNIDLDRQDWYDLYAAAKGGV